MYLKLLPLLLICLFWLPSKAQVPGNALDFDGANDLVNCPLPGIFDSIPSRDITVEAWIFPRQAAFQRVMYAQLSTSFFFNFAYNSTQQIYFYVVSNGTTFSQRTDATLPLNQWTHVACRWTATTQTVEIFFNGVLQSSAAGGSSSTGTNGIMSIGSRPGGAQYFNGLIDEMRIWREARAACDIAANYQAEFNGPVSNLVAYYDFNQGVPSGANPTVTTLQDQVAPLYNGTLANFNLNGGSSNWVASTAPINNVGPNAGGFVTNVSVDACTGSTYTFPDGSTQTINGPVTQTSLIPSSSLCDSTIITTVTPLPTALSQDSATVCSGGDYTFPDGSTQTNITSPTIYTSLLSTTQGCDSTVITFLDILQGAVVSDTASVCSGGSYTFPDGSSQTNIIGPTTYTSLLSTAQGCDSTVITFLGVLQSPVVQDSGAVCSGGSYTFPDGSTQTGITAPTTYTSILSTTQGCDSTVVTFVGITSVNTSVTATGPTITANAANATFQWLDCNAGFAPIPNANAASFSPAANGDYAVAVTQNGCTDTSACVFVNAVSTMSPYAIGLEAYPNPAENQVRILVTAISTGTIEIADLHGRLLLRQPLEGPESLLDLHELTNGIYLLKVSGEGRSQTIRLVKQ